MLKLYFTSFLLVGCSVFSFNIRDGHDECCDTKTVGDVTYELVDERDTSGYGCISNCVYKPVGESSSSSFCFKEGNLPATCGNGSTPCPCTPCCGDCCSCDNCTGYCPSTCPTTTTTPQPTQ